jgi:hypothetical protein
LKQNSWCVRRTLRELFEKEENLMQPEEVIAAVKEKAKNNFKTGLN